MSVFVAVAELQGFAPAARRLGLSPSAVTRLVATLEERLDTRLLQRTTRSVTLTDAGTRFLERAKRILADVTEAEEAARTERSVPMGRFVLTASSMFGRLHVAPVMGAFLAKYPELTGELMLADRIVNLVEEGIDVAVRIGVLEDSSYVARAVGATRRVVVASKAYLALMKTPRTPDDLARHHVIQCTSIAEAPEWRFFKNGVETRVPLRPRYVTNSVDAALDQAARGGGVTMAFSYQVADAVRSGKLAIILKSFEPPLRPIHIVYPTTRLLSAKVRAFVELVTTTCDWTFVDL